jgi:hypothetical protein
MALFSRRRLWQSLINVQGKLSSHKLKDFVSRLNSDIDEYAATEWELVVLDAFSQLGSVRYEPEDMGHVDIDFRSPDGAISFAADVITISDNQLHKENPAKFFADEMRRRIRKRQITHGSFFYEIGEKHRHGNWGRGSKRSLLLPHVMEFPSAIFDASWRSFLGSIRDQPGSNHSFHAFRDSVIDVRVTYAPNVSLIFSGSHGSYTSANVLTDNPLFSSLRQKARKLKSTKAEKPIGMIVCDGGCQLLTTPAGWESYQINQIIAEFFRERRTIAFVLIVAIKSSPRTFVTLDSIHDYSPTLFMNPSLTNSLPNLLPIFASMVQRLPKIYIPPSNVASEVKWYRPILKPEFYIGGWQWTANTVRMSSRELMSLLTGALPSAAFAQNHRLGNGGNSFLTQMANGKKIISAKVERKTDEDDDDIIFEFGGAFRAVKVLDCVAIDSCVALPSREFLYFLAGIVKLEELLAHVSPPDGFERATAAGQMINEALSGRYGKSHWIQLTFGARDPAVSPFWTPNVEIAEPGAE